MLRGAAKLWLVESLTFLRLFGALLFASLALHSRHLRLVSCIYGIAMGSDLIDGYLARQLQAESYFGKIVDLVSDKSLTIVSLLYASARGIDLLPLAIIATREIIMIGARLITIDGAQLFPTNKILGGVLAGFLWGTTLFLVLVDINLFKIANDIYWACAIFYIINLIVRIYTNTQRIKASLNQ